MVALSANQSTALHDKPQPVGLIQMIKGKEVDRETLGATIWNQTSKKLITPGDSWRDWLRIGAPVGVMLAAYAPEGTTKALIDYLID